MKVRPVINFSFAGLLAIVVIQLVGMIYACHIQMKETEESLNKCFRMAFDEVVDNVVNNLPYPDGTAVNIIYAPDPGRAKIDQNEYSKLGAQQTAWVLKEVYGKDFPLATLDSVLHNKLGHAYIKGETTVERFNIHTGEILESTNRMVHQGITTATSEHLFVSKPKGEAVRAIVSFPFWEIMRNVLILSGITFLLLFVAVYMLAVQLKMLVKQQHSLQEQQEGFYTLAEKMHLPVMDILSEILGKAWGDIEDKTKVLLDMTEKTLSRARAEEQVPKAGKPFPFKPVFICCLVGVSLLLAIWSGYLYYVSYQKMKLQVEEKFEDAFYSETLHHRYKQFKDLYPEDNEESERINTTPYVDRLYERFRNLYKEKGYSYYLNYVLVYHLYNKFDENFRMHAAYALQDSINHIAKTPIPFSLHYADSAFNSELRAGGFSCEGNIHWIKYPSGELVHQTGDPEIGIWDMSTKLIPLDEDSLMCVRAVVRSPQGYIIESVWYMLLSLGVTFLFVCLCIFFLVRMLRMQRHLKQFQKDFTYSMIHDMKSPLQSVIMGAHILSSGKLADKYEKTEKYRQAMTEECRHLLALSNRVVMLTRIDRGELELHKEVIDLGALLKDLTEKFQLKATKPVHFETLCEEDCVVYADVFCLYEVLSNLIDNAIKYSGEEVTVTLSGQGTESGMCISVRDNGIGIPLREQQKIFDKFERISSGSRKTGASGFGLGLNYVQKVMMAHGGRVEVQSEENCFTEFMLYFPDK